MTVENVARTTDDDGNRSASASCSVADPRSLNGLGIPHVKAWLRENKVEPDAIRKGPRGILRPPAAKDARAAGCRRDMATTEKRSTTHPIP